MKFTALDFETANGESNSVCSVAIVSIHNNEIADEYYTLVKPPEMRFADDNIRVHQIRPWQVEDKPNFSEIWPQLQTRLEGKVLLAHYAPFDVKVLRSVLRHYNLEWPDIRYGCTVEIAKRVWPELPNHKLNTMGNFLGITFNHHHALEDARTCAEIARAACAKTGTSSLEELLDFINVKTKPLRNGEVSQTSLL